MARKEFWILMLTGLLALEPAESCEVKETCKADPGRAKQRVGFQGDWTKYPGNPVYTVSPPGEWDSGSVTCFNVKRADSLYWMWYSASGHPGGEPTSVIGVATSEDGVQWQRHPDPILTPGPRGSWDQHMVGNPEGLYDEGIFKLWYIGRDTVSGTNGIGYATSQDGFQWTKHGTSPVITEPSGVGCLAVVRDGDSLYTWYMSQGLNRASSTDGIVWHKYPGNPVFIPDTTNENAWDSWAVVAPSVVVQGGVYHLWYTGAYEESSGHRGQIQIGHATSTDKGITWMRDPDNPVLWAPTQEWWEGKSAYSESVVMGPTLAQMWYTSGGSFGYAWKALGERKGDVNGDGKVNVLDVVLAVNIILGLFEPTSSQFWAADFNDDGVVNIVDVILIVNEILDGGENND